MNQNIPRDVLDFLTDYPSNSNNLSQSDNLLFYQNKLRCRPDRLTIDELHERWQGVYDTLEYKHGFIQWLFPIQEYGMNSQSQPLQRHEIETMRSSSEIIQRVIRSYKLMLDFYGMRLLDEKTGLLDRVLPPRTFERRYKNLVQSSHNNLRISRILKCLSEMGLEHLNVGFVLHVLNEQSEHKELATGMLKGSMDRWWASCNRNEEEREWVAGLIRRVRSSRWVFTRDMYEKALKRRDEQGSLGFDDVDMGIRAHRKTGFFTRLPHDPVES
ncbi:opioid growth factor receptor conserved region-domain-containing protein [Armillaria mellea]|nr:opioid growth factor receptor conserved region-domain-containing protein [Armillaria mellea]